MNALRSHHQSHINQIKISSSKQFTKNPFQGKASHFHHTKSCKFHSREYYNYKQISEDPPIDFDAKYIQGKSDCAALQQQYKEPLLSRDTEEMLMEIQLSITLSPEIEKELRAIFAFKRITPNEISEHRIMLPSPRHTITLFIDLDETLISSKRIPFSNESDLSEVCMSKFSNPSLETSCLVHFAVRPFCKEFLQAASENFDLVVFTASEKEYADSILDIIDPNHLITFRLYRQNCILRDMHYIKDLRIVDRDLRQCVAIDNSVIAFMEQLDNLVPISMFQGSRADTALIEVASFLDTIKHTSDVSKFLSTRYCLTNIYNHLNL